MFIQSPGLNVIASGSIPIDTRTDHFLKSAFWVSLSPGKLTHIINRYTCEQITLYGTRDFAGVLKGTHVKMGDNWSSRCLTAEKKPTSIHEGSVNGLTQWVKELELL